VRLTVLGSGDAFSGCGCNAGYIVDGRVLVDCGAPVHVLVHRTASSINDIRLLLVTHFHADHTFMLPLLLGARAFALDPASQPLTIAGPVGTKEYAYRLLLDGYGTHILSMVESDLRPRFVVLQDGSDVALEGYRVRAHAVVHSLGPSLAYTLRDESGTTIGFSGDSTMCAGLERSIKGCDAYVCECTSWDNPVPGGHLWSGQVATLIAAYPDTAFIISHLTERRELRGAIVAHDLLTLDIRSGTSSDQRGDD
jgi:ribonuclease BN (tRNA processing enzyme)